MPAAAVSQQTELLTSWKEIASYLGKGVRTVQRWEQQYGLPVRRPNEKAKGIVHATRQDLDNWLGREWSQQRGNGDFRMDRVNDLLESVRVSIQQSALLRRQNSALLADVRNHVESMIQECQVMSRNMTGTLPPPSAGHDAPKNRVLQLATR